MATRLLFEQGAADPRGCEYRAVEILDPTPVATHAFVVPAKPGEARRFAVGWDGILYRASAVGKAADIDADLRALVAELKAPGGVPREHEGPARVPSDPLLRDGRRSSPHLNRKPGSSASVGSPAPMKVCVLLRLGRPDLAEALFASGTSWKPGDGRETLDYRVSYARLADEWVERLYNHSVDAHERAEDEVALDAARRVRGLRRAGSGQDRRAIAPGAHQPGVSRDMTPPFRRLGQFDELLIDQEHRAKEPPRRRPRPRRHRRGAGRRTDPRPRPGHRPEGGSGGSRPGRRVGRRCAGARGGRGRRAAACRA